MLFLHLPVAAAFLFCLKLLLLSFLSTFFAVKLFRAFLLGKSPSAHSYHPSHPFIGCLLSFFRNCHRLLFWYTDLSNSPTLTIRLYRLGATRTFVTANPANVEYVLKTNFNNFPKGKPFTDVLGDFLGYGIFNADGDLWRVQRKLASHEFSTKSLREFVVKTVDKSRSFLLS